jgi:hypothetical protein
VNSALFQTILLFLGIFIFPQIHLSSAETAILNRPDDPVVLSGSDLPWLTGLDPDDLVAFRYDSGWQQIPLQVDERDWRDLATIYDTTAYGVVCLVYTDSSTFTGPDSDPTLDDDDELVFMAGDAGDAPITCSEPSGVISGTGVQISLQDSLDGSQGQVYLFQHDGSLSSDADTDYVAYHFNLLSGDYKTTYQLWGGGNPESSYVTTSSYQHHFSDRWVEDQMRVFRGSATGADILDRHKIRYTPGNCGRTEDTFSMGEGCFIVNKSGPVRAVRSYLGCNSGPWTQRDHFFYQARHDMVTHLRVHEITSITDYFDYSPAAAGMTYHNDLNPEGVTIDGSPDSVAAGILTWEMVQGAQGGLIMSLGIESDIPDLTGESYYHDDLNPSIDMCTGDDYNYGASGMKYWPLPNTDPGLSPPVFFFIGTRYISHQPPGVTPVDAESRSLQMNTPLVASAESFAVPVAPEVRAEKNAQDVELIWVHQEPNEAYEIWRDIVPAFDPAQGEGEFLDSISAVPGSLNYTDADRIGDPETNYFYILRATLGNQKSPGSQAVGEFDRSLRSN